MKKLSRRRFLGSAASAAVGSLLGASSLASARALAEAARADSGGAPAGAGKEPPWTREGPLREAARSAVVRKRMSPTSPVPDVLGIAHRHERAQALAITNPAIKSGLWGPSHRVTLSLIKTDVHDRRVKWPRIVTLKEIVEGAYAPVNRDAVPVIRNTTRSATGYLMPGGGRSDPYAEAWHAYPFPCQKPVGQIVLMMDDLEGAPSPMLTQGCADGLVRFALSRGKARAEVEVILSMSDNVYGIRLRPNGFERPARLRLYRHRDQGHLDYMAPDGRFLSPPNVVGGGKPSFRYEDDSAWNGPVDPPECGRDGRYFWIRQRMPAEKTFPRGFHYVMMGIVAQPEGATIETEAGKTGLGTPPYGQENGSSFQNHSHSDAVIRDAPGSAATASFSPRDGEVSTAYVAIVSELDAEDFMSEARRRLEVAEAGGFDGLVRGNTAWYGALFDRRENGRVYYGGAGSDTTEDIPSVYASWYCRHEGGCKTDMRRLQASAPYARVESDWQPWHGYPCYNDGIWEYATPSFVRNRGDAVSMWRQLVEHWWQASRGNAHDMYGMPGMALMHGYLPPIKADRYVHTNLALELCMDTLGQVLKALWDEWDYGGDPEVLEQCYPMLRDMALFYAAYVKKGDDGFYHVIPAVEQERWGIFPRFSHSKDTTGSLCTIRWALRAVAGAAELLGRDADRRGGWREIADRLLPYSTWTKPDGPIFEGARGVEPFWFPGDHEYYEGTFPTTLTGELNLDSDAARKEIMVRTARTIQDATNAEVLVLLGICPDVVASVYPKGAPDEPIRDWRGLRAEVDRYPERLLNSRGGRIHLFPCVPSWAEVGFRGFQARGGFLVSAARDRAGVYFAEIEARRDRRCAVINPWPSLRVRIEDGRTGAPVGFRMDRTNGECIEFDAAAGRTYRIVPEA